ncbi:hypothetical protein Tsubulata_002813 [Turnera subulata]|uniref:Uncharacterized protein n=1 Tax=Turnera subulata TaxID=218843 RepID=A0A9Q0EZ22_9ROSI|nr:hypothetical protein Tsubulata_002813 [Turnera subulata]
MLSLFQADDSCSPTYSEDLKELILSSGIYLCGMTHLVEEVVHRLRHAGAMLEVDTMCDDQVYQFSVVAKLRDTFGCIMVHSSITL